MKNEQRQKLFFESMRIRKVEEEIVRLFPSDLIQSPVHLSIGQEAVAVGVCASLRKDDLLFPTYRGHSFYLAKGGPLGPFFAELMGRSAGISKGKGGSMHLADPQNGLMGASAIVGSTISHAVGAALAENIVSGPKSDRVFVSVFGDGAMEQGTFFESLNFASLKSVPVLFVCEDNGLAVHTHPQDSKAFSLQKIVEAFGITFTQVSNGFDPEEVFKSAELAVKTIRKTRSPQFLNIQTMRYKEHVGPGEDFEAGYRSQEVVEEWKAKDPLEREDVLSFEQLETIQREIEASVRFALDSPEPEPEEMLTDVE